MNLRSKVVRLTSFSSGHIPKKKITPNTISHLITKCKWKKLLKVLRSCDKDQIECGKCSDSHSFLHLACRFDPPLSLIQELFIGNPHSILELDCQNCLPLHIAVMNGARVEVIDYLLRHNHEAAWAQDCEGKTPLHLLFTHYGKNIDSFSFLERIDIVNTFEIAKLICRKAPKSVIVEDFKGMTALEYAIEKEVCFDVVRVLQKVSVKVMKSRFDECSNEYEKMEESKNGRRHSMTWRTEEMKAVTNPAA